MTDSSQKTTANALSKLTEFLGLESVGYGMTGPDEHLLVLVKGDKSVSLTISRARVDIKVEE